MKLTNPRIYHYCFSHIPVDESVEKAENVAEDLVVMLVKDLRLKQGDVERFPQPHPDVSILSFYTDEKTKTSLLQFLCHDLITTIVEFNRIQQFPLESKVPENRRFFICLFVNIFL